MISAKIVADSLSPQGDRLVSVLAVFPRIILAEVNTHRMLSKNTASSRAIPFKKMVATIKENPFVPIAWQKDHSGMQGSEYFTGADAEEAEYIWLSARDRAVENAEYLNQNGVTKQLCNRGLETYMWTTMLITGSIEGGWNNFFNLRCPDYQFNDGTGKIHHFKSRKDAIKSMPDLDQFGILSKPMTDMDWLLCNKGLAEIHMMQLAECIYDVFNESTPKQLQAGEWHIPFGDQINPRGFATDDFEAPTTNVINSGEELSTYLTDLKVKVSTAMGARTSYTVVGDEKEVSYSKLIELDDKLLNQWPPHSSPMEHCSRAMNDNEYFQNIKGYMTCTDRNPIKRVHFGANEDSPALGWCRNYRGFIQRRHLIETGG